MKYLRLNHGNSDAMPGLEYLKTRRLQSREACGSFRSRAEKHPPAILDQGDGPRDEAGMRGASPGSDRRPTIVKRSPPMHIKELMTHPAVTCSTGDHLDVPARLMWEYDCGLVPVVNDEGRLAGVVTDRDICMAAYTQGQPLHAIPVTTAMASKVLAGHADDAIEDAERLMRDAQIRRLPIVDEAGRPEGVLSLNDIARATARTRKSSLDRELVATLAAICEPRAANGAAGRPQPVIRTAAAS
jgi:CBS domain-containing protein